MRIRLESLREVAELTGPAHSLGRKTRENIATNYYLVSEYFLTDFATNEGMS
jgi:hypothetical protein